MRILPTFVHAITDYVLGLLLIAAPWIFGFPAGAATWVPVVLGAGVLAYSLATNYELGLVGLFSVPAHLTMDVLGGLVLALSPWVFGFASTTWAFHTIVGIAEIGTALMTRTVPSYAPGSRSTAGTA